MDAAEHHVVLDLTATTADTDNDTGAGASTAVDASVGDGGGIEDHPDVATAMNNLWYARTCKRALCLPSVAMY